MATSRPPVQTTTPSPTRPFWTPGDWLRVGLMIVLAAGYWCLVTGRTSAGAWQIPLDYGVKGADADALSVLATLKNVMEGEFIPFAQKTISRLGAPYAGNWSDAPCIEEWILYFTGMLGKGIGLFAAANATVMIAQILACVSFYVVARVQRCSWWWAFAGAFVFGFSLYGFARSVHHIGLTHFWYVPFCVLCADWITRGEMNRDRLRFALGVGLLAGMMNPYYTNMYLQLVLLGAFYQYFRQGWRPVLQAFAIVGASAAGFFLMNLDTYWYHFRHGANEGALVRNYIWLELSALKFLDMLVPPPGHGFLGFMGKAYYGTDTARGMVAFPGEVPPSCYLGLLGIAALVWLAVVSIRRLVVQTGRNLPLEAWQVLWILAYAAVGGINCVTGVFGMQWFRSSTRYCIFILPIVLFFAIKRLSKRKLDASSGSALAVFFIVLAIWDQSPPTPSAESLAADQRMIDSDREFMGKVESQLPKGAMVFQLPQVDFPESPVPGVSSSDHFRAYVNSQSLRFAFGDVKGRPWLAWQHDILKGSFDSVIRSLENYGFAALYVNRNGFQDKGEQILNALKSLGYTNVIESQAGDLFCVLLHPSANPILPYAKLN